jgi:DNA-binding CsgD family transcriptional regulator
MLTEATLLALVNQIYAAAIEPANWSGLLANLRDSFGAGASCLIHYSSRLPEGRVEAASRLDPAAAAVYGQYFGARDPWAAALARKGTLNGGVVCAGEAVLPHPALQKTEYYCDYARKFGLTRNVFAAEFSADQSHATVVTLLRPDAAPPFEQEAVDAMRVLFPHFRRAFQVHERLQQADAARNGLADAVEALRIGVVLLDSHARVVFANGVARTICASQDGLCMRGTSLLASLRADNGRLKELIGQATGTANGQSLRPGGALSVARPSGLSPFSVVVAPLRASRGTNNPAPALAVFITDPTMSPGSISGMLCRLYGLTPRESRLAETLLWGSSVQEAADRLHITANTARVHLKRVLAKTGTHRQAQLVRLLLSAIPPVAVVEAREQGGSPEIP